jgi:hypothetical protein
MIGDHYNGKFNEQFPGWVNGIPPQIGQQLTREEFNAQMSALRKDMEEMKALLARAIEYDTKNNEPHCETDEKYILLKLIAKAVNIDLDDILKSKTVNKS